MKSFSLNSFCLRGVSNSLYLLEARFLEKLWKGFPSVQPKLLRCQNSKLRCSTATNSTINFQSFSASFTPINPNITTKGIFLPLAPSHIFSMKSVPFSPPLSAFDTILMPFISDLFFHSSPFCFQKLQILLCYCPFCLERTPLEIKYFFLPFFSKILIMKDNKTFSIFPSLSCSPVYATLQIRHYSEWGRWFTLHHASMHRR